MNQPLLLYCVPPSNEKINGIIKQFIILKLLNNLNANQSIITLYYLLHLIYHITIASCIKLLKFTFHGCLI